MPAARVPRYELDPPDTTLVLRSLARYVDDPEAEELWASACARAGIAVSASHDPEALLRAVEQLEQLGDLAATCAKGLRVRIRSYMVLAAARRPE